MSRNIKRGIKMLTFCVITVIGWLLTEKFPVGRIMTRYRAFSNDTRPIFGPSVSNYRPGSSIVRFNRPGTSISGYSYYLWKSIRLHPEDMRGNSAMIRYGEPLSLYVDNDQPLPPSWTSNWTFRPRANDVVNCADIFLGKQDVVYDLQEKIMSNMREDFIKYVQQANTSCNDFIQSAGYITDPLTTVEADFPIAFSIIMYRDVEQFEFLLRSIYRPQNVYCVHVDKKSPQKLHDAARTIANCFENVFLTSYSVDVIWSAFTNLEPELICLRELWHNKIKWKYFINLTGQEFPLRTNFELVQILMAFDGANKVGSHRPHPERLVKAGPAPYGLTPVKGSLHVALSRAFVDFVLHNETSLALLEWSRPVIFPDEIYFNTLNYNKQLRAPGAYKGLPQTTPNGNPFITRLKHWQSDDSSCHGKHVRGICIFGTEDLPLLATREELFANKLHFDYHPEVMLCMQELLYNRTADEYEGRIDFNVSYYATRDFVKNKF